MITSARPALLESLRLLATLRTIAIVGQVAAIVTARALGVALLLAPMLGIVGLLIGFEIYTWYRVRRADPASHAEIAAHLLLDLSALTALLYLSGGAQNPFCLLFVLHVVLVSMLLPAPLAMAGTLLILAAFTVLTGTGLPLVLQGGGALPAALVLFGYWLSMALTGLCVAWFVNRSAEALREHHRLLLAAARKAQNDETILRLGALAAGAAHELASPLTTMGAVADTLGRNAPSLEIRRDAAVLSGQIEACRRTLSNLLAAAGHARAEGGGRQRLDAFLDTIVARFRAMRPDSRLTCEWQPAKAPEIYGEHALQQAILVLLNNAADASPDAIDLGASWDDVTLRVTVSDRGTGIPEGRLAELGQAFFTTKPRGKGTGLGLVLAANAVKQLDGTLRWQPRAGGGTRAEMVLPLRALALPASD